MAARAGTVTVMEAVETAEDAALLRYLGIDYAQGYFFLRPLPGRELVQAIRAGLSPVSAASLAPFPTSLSAS